MLRRRNHRGWAVRSGAVVVAAAAGLLGVASSAVAAGRPAPTTTTTTTTVPLGPGSLYITFGGGGGYSIGSGTSASTPSVGPFGTSATLHPVGRRATSGNVQLRVYAGSLSSSLPAGLPGFPAASCLPDRTVLADVSTDSVAGTVTFYRRSTQQVPPQGSYVGLTEGTPVAVVAAQVPSGTREAVMRFAGGPTDHAAPLAGGWVVLAAQVKAPPAVHRPVPLLTDTTTPPLGTLSTVDRLGHTHAVGPVPAAIGYPIPSSCLQRPPGVGGNTQPLTATPTTAATLPQPTGPAPTDQSGARQAIETAYRRVFESPANRNNNRYLQGSPVLTPSERRQLQAGYGDILGKIRVRFNDFRFLNSTQAALSFDLLLNGQPINPTTSGEAVLINGQWQVTRASFCAVITRSNITCG